MAEKSENSEKLYKFSKAGWFGGVCAGIAYKLKIQTWIVRLLWTLATLFLSGWPLIIYILLWIFVPGTDTPEDYKQVCE